MSKIENIREALIKLTVKNGGYEGISIRKIAKKAKVSVGYMYRHYDGKEELIGDIIDSRFYEFKNQVEIIIDSSETFDEILTAYIDKIFQMLKTNETELRFLMIIVSDINFFQESNDEKILDKKEFLHSIYDLGIKKGAINPKKINFCMFLTVFMMMPFNYLMKYYQFNSLGFENLTKEGLIESKENLIQMCLDALS